MDPDSVKDRKTLELKKVEGKAWTTKTLEWECSQRFPFFCFFLLFLFVFFFFIYFCQVARQQGEYLPVIAFGNIKLLETYQDELEARFKSREVPANPGCFALSEPYEGFVLIIHDLCPARYVNDAKERQGVTKNVQFHQHPDPRSLYYDPEKGFQLFLRLQATRDIAPNEELCCAYGTNFWDATARNVKGIDERMKEAKTIETQLEDEEQEEQEKEEAERKKEEEREKKEKEEQEKAKKKGKKKPAAKVVEDFEVKMMTPTSNLHQRLHLHRQNKHPKKGS